MNLFGPNEFICRPCYAEQNSQIVEYKKNKPVLYSECEKITENVYLGNEDAAIDEEMFKKFNFKAVCVCGSSLLTPFEND